MLAIYILLVVIQLSLQNILHVILEEIIEILTLLFCAYFCGEVGLRLIGQGLVTYHFSSSHHSLSPSLSVCLHGMCVCVG